MLKPHVLATLDIQTLSRPPTANRLEVVSAGIQLPGIVRSISTAFISQDALIPLDDYWKIDLTLSAKRQTDLDQIVATPAGLCEQAEAGGQRQ